MELTQYMAERKALIDEALDRYLPPADSYPPAIYGSMRYSLFPGGKRLRPILALAACEAVGGEKDVALPLACALELVHTYSLIHDDLPALDDDELRRGRATSHIVFGEGVAILAGDALLTHAFGLMADPERSPSLGPSLRLRVIHRVAEAIGSRGMIGGQVVDIQSKGREIDADTLHYIHTRKTGALIRVSLWAGGALGGGSERELEALEGYGERVGLAFQVVDDILDEVGERRELGKPTGRDRESRKATYPALWGLEASKRKARELVQEAVGCLEPLGERGELLAELAEFIILRRY
ncbi:MAG: polyprenyl synthetase family protein [Nitrospinota bacterium]